MKYMFEVTDILPGTVVRLGQNEYLIRESAEPSEYDRYELVSSDNEIVLARAPHLEWLLRDVNALSFEPVSPTVHKQNNRLESQERIKNMGLICTLDEALEWYRGSAVLADPEPDWIKTARARVHDLVETNLMK